MRSAEQIKRTPREYHDWQVAERSRICDALLEELRRARESGAEWYAWIAGGGQTLSAEAYARLGRPGGRRGQAGRQRRSS